MRTRASRRKAGRVRVCHVIHDLRRGGAEHLLVDLAGVAAAGIEMSVVGMMPTTGHGYTDALRSAGVLYGMIGQTAAYHQSADHL